MQGLLASVSYITKKKIFAYYFLELRFYIYLWILNKSAIQLLFKHVQWLLDIPTTWSHDMRVAQEGGERGSVAWWRKMARYL